jgi:hypothetical protein
MTSRSLFPEGMTETSPLEEEMFPDPLMHPEGRPLPHGRKTHLGNRVTLSPARATQLKPVVAFEFSCYQAGNRKLRGSVLETTCVHGTEATGQPD